jgi:hypothetical protein
VTRPQHLQPEGGCHSPLAAYSTDGASLGASGFPRLVVPNDMKKGRWVSNLVSLEVFSASPVPEPASAATLLRGLAVLARKRLCMKVGTPYIPLRSASVACIAAAMAELDDTRSPGAEARRLVICLRAG